MTRPPTGVVVRPEAPADADTIRGVTTAAFGRAEEARIVDALRAGDPPYIGLVAEAEGEITGHIAFSPATLHCYGALFPIMALGPMAVRPDRQRTGIGSALVREGLAACHGAGHDVVVVLGHPKFYPRFGFVAARPLGLMCEWDVPDDVFLVAELTPGALRGRRGVVIYSLAFAVAGE